MAGIRQWLGSIGLTQYAESFEQNDIVPSLLPELNEQDLERLGVTSLGHRKRLLKEIATLDSDAQQPPKRSVQSGLPRAIERRQLTVMFVDLVGSTALSQSLDPEDLGELNRIYQNATRIVIEDSGGFVAKYLGDGILVYFGYPKAREDDAERAVRAALKVVKRTSQLDAESELQVRIGIATGSVVVGEMIGEGASQENSVVGATPNLAARLQEIASPGSVLISDQTSRLLGTRFELRELPPQSLKGFEAPVRAFTVEHELQGQSRFSVRTGRYLSSFVGRSEEIEILKRRWEKGRSGNGQIVLVSAEPGMGKSRLVQEACNAISGGLADIALFQCSKDYENSSFHPVLAHMETASHGTKISGDLNRVGQLKRHLRKNGNLTENAIALISRSLNLGTSELSYELRQLDPFQLRERTLVALSQYVVSEAEASLGICVFEDLHWADPSTLELIERVVETCVASRCVILMTTRPGFAAAWADLPNCSIIQLPRLDHKDAEILARSAREPGPAVDTESIQTVIDRAGGIPLFVEELARSATEVDRDGTDHSSHAIPATLHDLLMARLDALEHGKAIAQLGSVLGREFSLETLRRIWDGMDSSLEKGLEELRQAGLVFGRVRDNDSHAQFKHALVQDAAYGSLLRSKRSFLHGRVAQALLTENKLQSEIQPELIAHHLTAAHEFEEAIAYWSKAGERALSQTSYKEGAAHLQHGLGIVGELEDIGRAQQLEADLLAALGPALIVLRGYASREVGRTYERLRSLIDRNSQLSEYLAPAQQGLRLYFLWRGELATAGKVATELLAHGNRTGDLSQKLEGHKAVAICLLWQGRLQDSRREFHSALAIADTANTKRPDNVRYDADSRSTCLSILSWNEWVLGRSEKAEEISLKAVESARASGHHFTLGEILALRCWFLHLQRRHVEAMQVSLETQALAIERDFPVWRALALLVEGSCRVFRGDVTGGVSRIEEALQMWSELGCALWLPHHYSALAVGHLQLGDLIQAQRLLVLARDAADGSGEQFWVPEILRLEALVLRSLGDQAGAEERLEGAIDAACKQGAKMWEVRATRDVAHLLAEQARRDDASYRLSRVYSTFSEGLETPDLRDVKALLEDLS
jgi:class 3 adenylate cyclase